MTYSMTGFAREQHTAEWGQITWEIRTVNHRYLDVRMHLPESLRAIESKLKQKMIDKIGRGKVDVKAVIDINTDATAIDVDVPRLQTLHNSLEKIQSVVADAAMPSTYELLNYPGILKQQEIPEEQLQESALNSLPNAIEQLLARRAEEGKRLAEMLHERAIDIGMLANSVEQKLPDVRQAWEDKLKSRLAELETEADPARLEQEIVFFAQRMDVAEEIDRIRSHIIALNEALESDEPIGRRLDFLMQEFNREANTLSSKSQDAQTTAYAVEMKVLIEQMREQVQNIE